MINRLAEKTLDTHPVEALAWVNAIAMVVATIAGFTSAIAAITSGNWFVSWLVFITIAGSYAVVATRVFQRVIALIREEDNGA